MTQQDKELLIKDLCARLPYGVKVVEDNQIIYSVAISNAFDIVAGFNRLDIKPILFPLSAINQEIEVNGKKRCISKQINNFFYYIDYLGRIDVEKICYLHLNEYLEIIDIFNRYHIDYRGLIDKGLAISVFDLQENPYK